MKLFVLLFLTITSVYANERGPSLKNAIGILDDFNNRRNYTYCDPDDPNAPAWCKDLYGYACSVNKTSNFIPALNAEINSLIWKKLPKQTTPKQFNDAAYQAITTAEANVYKITQVQRDEVRVLLSEAKSVMKTFITSTPFLPRADVREMSAKVDSVKLKYGTEYVEELVAYGKTQGLTDETKTRKQAYEVYMSMCGTNGLAVNAFYESGNLIICPGLLISLKDYNANKEQIKNALSFTFGHELGHAIDAVEYPDAYSKMKTCYQHLPGSPTKWTEDASAEISADYWGGIVLSERMKNLSAADSAKTIALAVDGFCHTAKGSTTTHPQGTFRLNQTIGKHQLIAEVLECAPATKQAPFCSLRGTYPTP